MKFWPRQISLRSFRPRFSLRTLAILVTLVCAYFGAWEVTKRHATNMVGQRDQTNDEALEWRVRNASAILPFVICHDDIVYSSRRHDDEFRGHTEYEYSYPRRYSLWFFGPSFDLPIENDWRPGH